MQANTLRVADSANSKSDTHRRGPLEFEDSAAALRQHIAGALSSGPVRSPGNFAPVPIRGGGGVSGITNLTDRQNTSAATAEGAAAEAPRSSEKKPNFFKRLFS